MTKEIYRWQSADSLADRLEITPTQLKSYAHHYQAGHETKLPVQKKPQKAQRRHDLYRLHPSEHQRMLQQKGGFHVLYYDGEQVEVHHGDDYTTCVATFWAQGPVDYETAKHLAETLATIANAQQLDGVEATP